MKAAFPKFVIGRLIVPLIFPIKRLLADQIFLYQLESSDLKPSPIAAPMIFLVRVWRYLRRVYNEEFTDYALVRYANFTKRHYSKEGRGYFSYDDLSDADRIELFGRPRGRIEPFLTGYRDVLAFADGDSFFDAGCGRGQNTKVLLENFPSSSILALDVSQEAITVIDTAVKSPKLLTKVGDLAAPETLAAISDGAYDHVVMCHVLSVMICPGLEATRNLRRRLVEEFARVAKKSVIIIDSQAIIAPGENFEIEQRDRGWFDGSILPCFEGLPGQTIVLSANHSFAVFYKHDPVPRD